jgi:hypothetical protein
MKKSTLTFDLTLVLIFLASITFAQGSWYIGGVAGYGSNTYKPDTGDEITTNSWAFGPEIGTFPKKDLQVGFILGLNGSMDEQGDEKTTTSYFTPTLYVRRFKSVGDALSVFGGLYLNYSSGKMDDNGDETTGSGVGINLGIGVAYALSPRFTAVGQYGLLGYSSTTYKSNGDEYAKENDFTFGVNTVGSSSFSQGNGSGSVFNIGIYYTFKTGE